MNIRTKILSGVAAVRRAEPKSFMDLNHCLKNSIVRDAERMYKSSEDMR